jgi:starch-binding outer membrane protein SusE/F
MKTRLLLLLAVFMTAFSVNAQNPTVVSITGEAQGGWGNGFDRNMTSTDGENWTYSGLNTTTPGVVSGCTGANCGGLKFRANNDWAINWGSADFPGGIGTQAGTNIQCTAGTWDVTFNSTTGAYLFIPATPPTVVKIVGTAVTGGTITMNPQTATTYSLPLTTFLAGTAKFEIGGDLSGGTAFPAGDLTSAATAINVLAGAYTSVTLDVGAGTYTFTAAPVFPSIGLIGSGTTGTDAGWGQDIDMATSNGIQYKLENQQLFSVNSSNGNPAELKFRQDDNWNIPSFGGAVFPRGTAVAGNANITSVLDGTYNCYFNLTTKIFDFIKVGSISLVGDAVGGWPDSEGNPGPVDVNMMSTTDGENYTLTNLVVAEGICKFRIDNNWNLPNFAGPSFPTGNADNSVSNITVPAGQAGTYNVTFNKTTKDYTFTNVTFATTSFSKLGFKVAPNPTQNSWNFISTKEAIVSVQVYDMLGKVVATSVAANVDASALNAGVYFAKVNTANASASVKVVKN